MNASLAKAPYHLNTFLNNSFLYSLLRGGYVRSQVVIGCLALLLCMTVVIFMPAMPTMPALAITRHGCASPTPPSVPGSLAPVPATPGILSINEVLMSPKTNWNCADLATGIAPTPTNDTWIEIYNPQSTPYDLYTAQTVLDSGPNTNNYYFPFGAAIAAKGFLVLFPRTNYQFYSTETPTLRLLVGGVVVDQIVIPSLGDDQSYARVPDGSTNWQISSSPTIDMSNNPIPATPTRTPTPTRASPTPKSTKSSSSSQGYGGGSYGGSTYTGGGSPVVDGVQPTWTSLHIPTTVAVQQGNAATPTTIGAVQPTQPAQPDNSLDLLHKIFLTVLLVFLVLVVFWCWKSFSAS